MTASPTTATAVRAKDGKAQFRAANMLAGACINDQAGNHVGSFATRAGADAVVAVLNQVMALPFDEIGTFEDGSSDTRFGRERVAHFLAKALGFRIARED